MIRISFILFFCFTILISEPLKIISFNIQGFKGKNKSNKISEIIKNIKEFDIIFIQENWTYDNKFLNELNNFKFISSGGKNIFHSAGLTIAFKNKFELLDFEIKKYNECNGFIFNGNDCLASKGFIYAKINLDGQLIDVYNTHLDAGRTNKDKLVRKKQLYKLKSYISNKGYDSPIIIAGDLNIDYFSIEKNILEEFKNDLDLKMISWNDSYFLKNKIDYIFYNKMNSFVQNIKNDALYFLSDHPPMFASFKFK